MKIRKVQAALQTARSVERSTQAALASVVNRVRVAKAEVIRAKTGYKSARKLLEQKREKADRARAAQKLAKQCFKKSAKVVERLERKLEKAEKKLGPKARSSHAGVRAKSAKTNGGAKLRFPSSVQPALPSASP